MTYLSVKLVYFNIFKYIYKECRGWGSRLQKKCKNKSIHKKKEGNLYIKMIRPPHSFARNNTYFIDLFRKRVGTFIVNLFCKRVGWK